MSTSIAKGEGKAIVIDTGKNTKFGQIASLTSEIQNERSPLQREIENTAKFNFLIALIVGLFVTVYHSCI
jgi:magnesium-transporting ATPase (P-type)